MTVPKASMDEDGCLPSREHEVRRAGEVLAMEPEAKPERVSCLPHGHLRLGVLRSNLSHRPRAMREIILPPRTGCGALAVPYITAFCTGSVRCGAMECHCSSA